MKTQLNNFSKKDLQSITENGGVYCGKRILKNSIIALFDGGYDRIGVIRIVVEKCDVCHKTKLVLQIDGSESEYAVGNICLSCIKKAYVEIG